MSLVDKASDINMVSLLLLKDVGELEHIDYQDKGRPTTIANASKLKVHGSVTLNWFMPGAYRLRSVKFYVVDDPP